MNAPLRELQVNVRDLRSNLAQYLAAAEAGTRIAITSRGKVVARLGPPEELSPAERRQRAFGAMRGRIRVAPDFDETPAEVIESLEADILPVAGP